MRYAFEQNILDADLGNRLGNYLQGKWEIVDLIPSAFKTISVASTDVHEVHAVTHWTVVLRLDES